MLLKLFQCCFLAFSLCGWVYAQDVQRFNVFNYTVNQGMLQSTILDMAIDKLNYIWISYPNGIQKFDGHNFVQVHEQEGLPIDASVQFYNTSDGKLFLAYKNGISEYDIETNRFRIRHSSKTEAEINFLGEYNRQLFFLEHPQTIFRIDLDTLRVPERTMTIPRFSKLRNVLYVTSSMPGEKYCSIVLNDQNYLLSLDNLKIADSITYERFYSSFLIEADTFFQFKLNGRNQTLYSRHIPGGKEKVLIKNLGIDEENNVSYLKKSKSGSYILNTDRVFKTNSDRTSIMSEWVNFQNLPIGNRGAIRKMIEDGFGNFYFLTVQNGIFKLMANTYPIRYYGLLNDKPNFTLSIFPDKKNNRIVLGTYNNGLLIYDSLERLVKQVKGPPGKEHFTSVNSILRLPDKGYFFSTNGDANFWKIDKSLSRISPVVVKQGNSISKNAFGYYCNMLYSDSKKAILFSAGNVYKINLAQFSVEAFPIFPNDPFYSGGLFKGEIVLHKNDSLFFLDTAHLKTVRKIPFPNTAGVRSYAAGSDNHLWIGTNKGIYKMNGAYTITAHYSKETGLPDDCIYALSEDANGNLWCSTNKGLVRLGKTGNILQLTKEDGLQENEFNTNVVSKNEQGEIYFGGIHGVNSFMPNYIEHFSDSLHLIVTSIQVNNDNPFSGIHPNNIHQIQLPAGENNLSFEFLAIGKSNVSQYVYQYRMKGVDEEWIINKETQALRYHLSPGKYVLQLYAGKVFNPNAEPLKEIAVFIRPPFYKTTWFITTVCIALLLLMIGVANRQARRRYNRKLRILESEKKLQSERERISRDLHDNIGAYANAVLYQTELLEKEKSDDRQMRLKEDLKFASKDIIVALREAVWALKKDGFYAEECIVRLRNFFQNYKRYYPHIELKVEGKAPEKKWLDHITALNIVRIVQEAVTNSIKHAAADSIKLQSSSADGLWHLVISDNGRGFDMKSIQPGNGLLNMKQRAEESGLGYRIESGDAGTIIHIDIPI